MEVKPLTATRALAMLKRMVKADGVRPTARALKLSPTYVCEIVKGKCPLGDAARDALEAMQ